MSEAAFGVATIACRAAGSQGPFAETILTSMVPMTPNPAGEIAAASAQVAVGLDTADATPATLTVEQHWAAVADDVGGFRTW